MTAIEMDAATARLIAEAESIEAANRLERAQERLDTAHLFAQTSKAFHEGRKAQRERWWYPVIVSVALIGGGAALGGAVSKFFEHPPAPAPAPQIIIVPAGSVVQVPQK